MIYSAEEKELLAIVMQYVDQGDVHHFDESEIEEELARILGEIEKFASDIEEGEYDLTEQELIDMQENIDYDKKHDEMLDEGAL